MKITKEYIENNLLNSGSINLLKIKQENINIEEIYLIYNDIPKQKCIYCNAHLNFINFKKGYKKTCPECRKNQTKKIEFNKSLLTKEYIKENFIRKDGGLNSGVLKRYNNLNPEELFLIFHELQESPKCLVCNKKASFSTFIKGYLTTCGSQKCAFKISDNKRKETNLNKYGSEYLFKTKHFKEKLKCTNLNKYNNENIFKTEYFKKKSKETKLKNHNDENYNNRTKSKETKLKNHNDENFNNRMKAKETLLKNYNVETFLQYHITNIKDYNEVYIKENFIKDGYFLLNEVAEYFSLSISHVHVLKKKFDIKEHNKLASEHIEEKINKIFDDIFILRTRNIIAPLEIDLFSHEYKFGIEYNGLMWHSIGESKHSMFNNLKDEDILKYKHLNKTNLCEEQNIQLFHIFENEWLDKNKKDIWISIIKEKMNKNKIINTKHTIIKEVNKEISKEFLEENHLDGYIDSSINLGLYKDDILYSIMCFNIEDGNSTLTRMCNKIGYSLDNSKILDYFKNKYKPETITIEVNRRFNNGDNLIKLGFVHKEDTECNCFYFRPKGKILLPYYPSNTFDKENRRIYDSGNRIFLNNLKRVSDEDN